MASPAAGFLEEWLPRDPTLELLHLAERWQPRFEPHRIDDVWFTADGRRALLLAETHAAAFDPDGQTRALEALRAEFERARGESTATLDGERLRLLLLHHQESHRRPKPPGSARPPPPA